MRKLKFIVALAFAAAATLAKAASGAGYTSAYVGIGRQHAVVYQPVKKSAKSAVGIVVMHSNDNYMGLAANSQLAKRGYTVIATVPADGDIMDSKLISIKNCVDYLRSQPGIKKVLLLGHSGGATVMTAYEMIAEQGVHALDGKLFNDYREDLSHLAKADGMLLLDANYGNSIMRLVSLEPNMRSNGRGTGVNCRLNLADPAVGYNADGPSDYSDAFVKEYAQAQRARLNDLMSDAFNRLSLIKQGRGDFADDEPFVVAGASQIRLYNKLFPQDLRLLSHTKRAWPLLHGDGSVTNEVVRSVRAPMKADAKSDGLDAAMTTTVRGFLSACAIRTTDDYTICADGFRGVDWTSNINNPIGNSEGIAVPTLLMGMTGSWEYLAAEEIYAHIASADKQLAFVEGASHMFFADPDAEKYNNTRYGDTVKALFDYVDKWISTKGRFM